MPPGVEWEAIPEKLLVDLGQLVKANSIEGQSSLRIPSACLPDDGNGQVRASRLNRI